MTCATHLFRQEVPLSSVDERVPIRSDERPHSKVRGRRWKPRMRLVVVALVVLACVMITSVVLYVDSVADQRIPAHGAPTSGGTTVTLNVVSISNSYNELVGDLIIRTRPALVDQGN